MVRAHTYALGALNPTLLYSCVADVPFLFFLQAGECADTSQLKRFLSPNTVSRHSLSTFHTINSKLFSPCKILAPSLFSEPRLSPLLPGC